MFIKFCWTAGFVFVLRLYCRIKLPIIIFRWFHFLCLCAG